MYKSDGHRPPLQWEFTPTGISFIGTCH